MRGHSLCTDQFPSVKTCVSSSSSLTVLFDGVMSAQDRDHPRVQPQVHLGAIQQSTGRGQKTYNQDDLQSGRLVSSVTPETWQHAQTSGIALASLIKACQQDWIVFQRLPRAWEWKVIVPRIALGGAPCTAPCSLHCALLPNSLLSHWDLRDFLG